MDELQVHTQDEVDQIIGEENKVRLRTCYEVGWKRWENLSPSDRKDISPRARANLIHDFAAAQAIEEFENIPGVIPVDQRDHSGYLALVFDDVIVLRFKKFRDEGFGTCSIATEAQQQFVMQEPPLPGIRTATNLVAGYLLNELETEIMTVAISCGIGDKSLWIMDITEAGIATDDETDQLQGKGSDGPVIRSASDEDEDVRESKDN